VQRPNLGEIPTGAGSYQFRDEHGRILYVGKATNLRSRVASYFADPASLHVRTSTMVAAASTVTWIEVNTEVAALMLEYNLIKQHRPRFNVRLRDDKSYPFLAISVDEAWPCAKVTRGRKRKGTRYFGPYAHAWAVRDSLDAVLRIFPVRTCSDTKFRQHERLGRPCLLFHIEKCSGPCVGSTTPESYRRHVDGLTRFFAGDSSDIEQQLRERMLQASNQEDFEEAARVRDRLAAIERALETQTMVATRNDDFDVVALRDSEFEASVHVFYVRKGRVLGSHGFIIDKAEPLDEAQLMRRVIAELYASEPALGWPREVMTSVEPEDPTLCEQFLSDLRASRVTIRVPQRGDRRELMGVVMKNASDALVRHQLRRASDHNARSRALSELQVSLGLSQAPLRIECFDMAHLQGTDYVGSMVVLEDGLPLKREYRRFKVKHVQGNDDYAAMREVLTRRLRAYLAERDEAHTDTEPIDSRSASRRRFSYPPQLLLVDGGKGQLRVAHEVVRELGLDDEIDVAAIAKRFEEVFVPDRADAVRIPRGSDALYMLQLIRDEAHRFANTFHRERRSKRLRVSELDGIPGLGPKRRERLVADLGGMNRVKDATLQTLIDLHWLPEHVARAVHERLHPPQ
jgi:excinuclease ABC subunit C